MGGTLKVSSQVTGVCVQMSDGELAAGAEILEDTPKLPRGEQGEHGESREGEGSGGSVLPTEGSQLRPTLTQGLWTSDLHPVPGQAKLLGAEQVPKRSWEELEGRQSWWGTYQWCSTSLIR